MQQPPPQSPDLQRELTNASARLRILEERIVNLRRKLQVTDQNMVAMHRSQTEDIKLLKEDISSLHNDLTDVKNTVRLMVSEMESFAKRDELLTVQKYLSYWEPIRFITEDQAEKIARQVFQEKQ